MAMIEKYLKPDRSFRYWKNDREFYTLAARTPRSNCILDVSKLLAAGVRMRNVNDALRNALQNWQPAAANIEIMDSIPEADVDMATLSGESIPFRPSPIA
jgi:hypothetical protein